MLASTLIREARRAGLPADSLTPVGSLRRFAPDIGDVSLLGVAPLSRHRQAARRRSRGCPASSRRAPPGSRVSQRCRPSAALATSAADRSRARRRCARLAHRLARACRAAAGRGRSHSVCPSDGTLASGGTPVPIATEDELYAPARAAVHRRRAARRTRRNRRRPSAARCRTSSPTATSAAISTCTARGATAATRSRTWSLAATAARLRVHRDHRPLRARAGRRASWPPTTSRGSARRSTTLRQRYPRHRRSCTASKSTSCTTARSTSTTTLLAGFDIVLASLHDHGGHDGAQLTERYLRAIRHPLVNVITHPANRSPAHSPGYDLDFDRLFAAAAGHGTAMEIDGAPGHLDMDGAARPPRGRRRRHGRRSTATATAPTRSAGRCASASARRGAAGSSRGTC